MPRLDRALGRASARACVHVLKDISESRGDGTGELRLVLHAGHGGLRLDQRPHVLLRDRAYDELGALAAPL